MITALRDEPSASRGDEALAGLAERHAKHLFAAASRWLNEELRPKVSAEDLVQETLLVACRHGRLVVMWEERRQRAWLRRVLGNQLKDAHRRYCQAARRSVRREARLSREVPSAAPIDHELVEWINSLLAKLPRAQRRIVVLRYWEGCSWAEIAEHCRVSTDAARRLKHRALLRLRRETARSAELPRRHGEHGDEQQERTMKRPV